MKEFVKKDQATFTDINIGQIMGQNLEQKDSGESFQTLLFKAAHIKPEGLNATEDISILATKIREKIYESVIGDIEGVIDERNDRNQIIPDDPGTVIKIDHLDKASQKELTEIFEANKDAFARNKFDCGSYTGMITELQVQEGKTVFEKERVMKEADKEMVRDIVSSRTAWQCLFWLRSYPNIVSEVILSVLVRFFI